MANALIVSSDNLSKLCRTCLVQYDEMHSIFSEIQNDENLGETTYLYEILMNVSSIRILTDDGFPTMICTNCIELAQASFKFQQQCNQSQEILESCIIHSKVCDLQDQSDKDDDKVFNLDANLSSTNQVLLSDDQCVDELLLPYDRIKETYESFESDSITLKPSQSCEDEIKYECTNELPEEIQIPEEQSSAKQVKIAMESVQGKCSSEIEDNEEKMFECNTCGKSYKHANSLRVHLRSHTSERRFICNHCGKGFNQYGSLSYHLRGHTGEQPYACKICGKRYKQSGTLTAHMRIHTGQRPFLCSVCGRGFRQAPDLGYHMRTHTKERPYMCNVCGKTMRMQCHLVQHLRTHSGERPYKCTECSKAFPSSTRLKRHAIIHTGLKPFTCEVCKKAFNRLSTLKVHAKIHTDERPHVCSFCGKGFIQAHALRTHLHLHFDKDESPNSQ